MRSSVFYAAVSFISYLLLFFIGFNQNLIYLDIVLFPQKYLPVIVIGAITLASVVFWKYTEAEIYIAGFLIILYGLFFVATLPYLTLLPYSTISLISATAYFYRTVGLNRRTVSKLAAFITIILAMFAIGSALRFDTGPPEYAMAFGSIYDDINPRGVPLMFTDGIIFYARYFVLSVSVPIVILFTALAIVLTENYYLIFRLLRSQGSANLRKTASNAVTVLSCQCEGITASFPSAIATILFTAIIPLITESIAFLLLTDILLVTFYLKGKGIRLLDRIWNVTSTRGFFAGMLVALIAVPVYSIFVVYLSLQENLLVFSSVNIVMFVYGIFVVFLIARASPFKRTISRSTASVLAILSSAGMFVWYVPQLTLPSVTSPLVFSVMSIFSVASGILSGIVLRTVSESSRRLYFEFITMMFSMLAIVIFYITAIGLTLIWPEFGIGEQLSFSLLLWGFTLPVMWLSTNISLNADSKTRMKVPFRSFTLKGRNESSSSAGDPAGSR